MNTNHNMKKIYLYTRFERFWHWTQAVLIFLLMITGLEMHGVFSFFGFKEAVNLHNTLGIGWLVLFVFIIFWLLTTGEWKQYIPTTKKLFAVALYYGSGIFKGQEHPVQKSRSAKHNPLQRLVYLGLSAILLPLQMITGLLYWTYNDWEAWGIGFLNLSVVATVHMACAYAILAFLVVHIYMTTTGHSLTAHISAMFSGWEDVPEDYKAEAWEVHDRKQ
jgi:thiosulfate reductase cytochrome b subunit